MEGIHSPEIQLPTSITRARELMIYGGFYPRHWDKHFTYIILGILILMRLKSRAIQPTCQRSEHKLPSPGVPHASPLHRLGNRESTGLFFLDKLSSLFIYGCAGPSRLLGLFLRSQRAGATV